MADLRCNMSHLITFTWLPKFWHGAGGKLKCEAHSLAAATSAACTFSHGCLHACCWCSSAWSRPVLFGQDNYGHWKSPEFQQLTAATYKSWWNTIKCTKNNKAYTREVKTLYSLRFRPTKPLKPLHSTKKALTWHFSFDKMGNTFYEAPTFLLTFFLFRLPYRLTCFHWRNVVKSFFGKRECDKIE